MDNSQTVLLLLLLCSGGVSLIWALDHRAERKKSPQNSGPSSLSAPRDPVWRFLLFLALCALLLILCLGVSRAVRTLFSLWFRVFFALTWYDTVLLLAIPLLRRHFLARDCARLWLLPIWLFLVASLLVYQEPLWAISLPPGLFSALAALWLLGFFALLGGSLGSHLHFRRWILRDASPVQDPGVWDVWRRELQKNGQTDLLDQLVISPQATTPLSIGLFCWSIRVVLPRRSYTPEELALIFRHELCHIQRRDSESKLALVFYTALCWPHPCMWLAMKRCAEDLELSCDEAVLADAAW